MQLRKFIFATPFIIGMILFLIISAGPNGRSHTAVAGAGTPDSFNYLPLVLRSELPTATPTATATATIPVPTVAPANVQITLIVYNPAGDDVAGEYVRLENKGGVTAVLTGWTLSDDDGQVFTFPIFSLASGASVQVWTKGGANNASNLYWGRSWSVWTNTGDVAYLRSGGTLVDSCSYSGGGVQASC